MADTVTISIPEGETLDTNDDLIVDNDLIWEWIDNQRSRSLSIRTVLALYVRDHGTGDIHPRKTPRRKRPQGVPAEGYPEQATTMGLAPQAPAPAHKDPSARSATQTLDATDINRLLDF